MGKFTGRKCRLICMFGLTTTFFLVEIVVGYVSNSMALVADSFHMLSDVAALVIAFVSIKMSPKKWSKSTFGWARAEVLGALVNAVFLVALCFSILVESLKRFYAIEEITNPELVLYVGSLGLLINLVGLGLFYEHGAHGHGHSHGGHGHSHGGHHKKQHKHGGGRRSEFVAQENEAAQQSDLEVHSKQIPAGEVGDGATGDAVMTNGARTLDNVANPLNGLVRVTSSPPQLAVETEGGRSRQRREETAAGKSEGNFRSSSSSDVSTSETEGSYDRNNMALLVAYIGVMKGGDPGALSHGQVKIGGDNGSQGKLTAVPSGECELENVRQRPTSPNGSPAKDDVEAAGSEGAGAGTKSGEGGTKVEVRQMNMRGIFLHVLADALGSVIVVISALVIWKTDWEYRFYLDPALSILMVLMILKSVWPLLVESAMVLLQTVPPHIRVEAIQNRIIQEVDGVLALHEFHVWQLTGDRIIASAHVRCKNLHDYKEISQKIKEIFHEEGIHSTTIQPEFAEESVDDGEDDETACSSPVLLSTTRRSPRRTPSPDSDDSGNAVQYLWSSS